MRTYTKAEKKHHEISVVVCSDGPSFQRLGFGSG